VSRPAILGSAFCTSSPCCTCCLSRHRSWIHGAGYPDTHPLFHVFSGFTLGSLRKILLAHRERGYDFCCDASTLGALLGLDALRSREVTAAFAGSENGL
jgi:hypothetical protein